MATKEMHILNALRAYTKTLDRQLSKYLAQPIIHHELVTEKIEIDRLIDQYREATNKQK